MSSEEDDVSRDIFALSHYASNKKRLINEAFKVLRGHKLESTIPPSLRDIDYTELKAMCLEELEKMSTITIKDILDGRILPSPQKREGKHAKKRASPIEEETAPVTKKKIKKIVKDDVIFKTTVDIAEEKVTKKKKEKKKKSKKVEITAKEGKKKKSLGKGKSKSKKSKKLKKIEKNKKKDKAGEVAKPAALTGERTLMELLELEYRAKAIKALLKFQGFKDAKLDEVFDEDSQDKSPVPTEKQLKPTVNPRDDLKAKASPERRNPPQFVTSTPGAPEILRDNFPMCDVDSTSSISNSVDETAASSSKPAVSNSDCKFELSIDVDDDLDFGNPDDVPDGIPTSPERASAEQSVKDVSSDVEDNDFEIHVPEDDRSLPASPQTDTYSDEECDDAGSDSFCTESNTKSLADSGDKVSSNFKITFRTKSSENAVTENASEETSCQFHSSNQLSPGLVDPDCDEISEAEEGELSNDDFPKTFKANIESDTDTSFVNSKVITKKDSPALAKKSKLSIVLRDDTDRSGYSAPEPTKKTEAEESEQDKSNKATKNISPAGSPVPASVGKQENTEIEKELNVNEDLDYEEAEEDESINVSVPSPYQDEPTPVTWYERWYSTKKVQKLVNSTKMCGKLRNKLRSEKQNKSKTNVETTTTTTPKEDDADVPIIGSVEEYEKLFGKKIVSQNLDTALPPVTNVTKLADLEVADESPDSGDNDEDDNDLWGDIIGNS